MEKEKAGKQTLDRSDDSYIKQRRTSRIQGENEEAQIPAKIRSMKNILSH